MANPQRQAVLDFEEGSSAEVVVGKSKRLLGMAVEHFHDHMFYYIVISAAVFGTLYVLSGMPMPQDWTRLP